MIINDKLSDEKNYEIFKLINPEIQEFLHIRLEHWAKWHLKREDNGLGYPSESIEYKLMKYRTIFRECKGLRPLPTDEAAEEIESMIKLMASQNFQSFKYAKSLRVFYLKSNCKNLEAAKIMGICERLFRSYLGSANLWLESLFTFKYGMAFIKRLTKNKSFLKKGITPSVIKN